METPGQPQDARNFPPMRRGGAAVQAALQRARRYPVWSAKAISLAALLAIILIAVLVLSVGHESLFKKIEITLSLIAAALYVFLAVGLYNGWRVKKEKLDVGNLHIRRRGGGNWDLMNIGSAGMDLLTLDAEGCVGVVVTIVAGIFLALVLALLFYLLIALLWPAILLLAVAVFWVFNRALRQVFIRSRTCKGNLLASGGYALFYTFLYTGWLFLVTWGAHRAFWK